MPICERKAIYHDKGGLLKMMNAFKIAETGAACAPEHNNNKNVDLSTPQEK
jgi:hypothetical protein